MEVTQLRRVYRISSADTEPSTLALAWTRQAPAALVSRLLAEARTITGWRPSVARP